MRGEGDQGRVEADGVVAAFQHGALEIIIQENPGDSGPGFKGLDMTGQERLHSRVQEEAQEDPARGTQDHDESHQRPSGAADLEMPEVTPVDLGLFAGKRAQPQVSLGLGAGAAWWSVGSQPATSQGEANGVAVDSKLAGDGSRAPLLNMIIA